MWAHDIHGSLLLRDYKGRELVGIVGIAMLISSLSGIHLWWPRRRLAGTDFGFRRGFALSRNLHYCLGFYSSLVLAMLRRIDPSSHTRGDAFLAIQRPLHEGEALGGIGRFAVFVVGFLPPLFAVTGMLMWLRGRRMKRRRAVAITPSVSAFRSE